MPVPFLDMRAMTDEVRPIVLAEWERLLDRSEFVGGDEVVKFERDWASYCGAARCIGVANGTDALHLVLRALDMAPGDEVVVPANTFVATAEAVVLAGATPVFADVDPHTLLMTGEAAAASITPHTRVVVAVHLFGQMADMTELGALCRRHGILLVEDAAQAHGAAWRGRPPGSDSVAACFSFYPGKNLGAFGDAGAVVTSDERLADAVAELRDHGRRLGSHHLHGSIGTNSRLDAMQAAVLRVKLPHLGAWNARRRRIADDYGERLRGTCARPVARRVEAMHVYHLMVVRVPARDVVLGRLASAGIDAGVHYRAPCHQLEPYRRYWRRPLPVVEQAAGEILSLPMYPHLDSDQIDAVTDALAACTVGSEAVVA